MTVSPLELRGRWIWALDALVPRLRGLWHSPPGDLAWSYGELADLAAIYAQLDWDGGVTYPAGTPLIGRGDLLVAVVDGGRRTG